MKIATSRVLIIIFILLGIIGSFGFSHANAEESADRILKNLNNIPNFNEIQVARLEPEKSRVLSSERENKGQLKKVHISTSEILEHYILDLRSELTVEKEKTPFVLENNNAILKVQIKEMPSSVANTAQKRETGYIDPISDEMGIYTEPRTLFKLLF